MSAFLSLKSLSSMDTLHHDFHKPAPLLAKERLEHLLNQVDDDHLGRLMHHEFKTMMADHSRLVNMLEQRTELLLTENEELKLIIHDNQRRYEKAVREMQFFKKKYESLKVSDTASVYSQPWPSSPSTTTSLEGSRTRANSNAAPSIYSNLSGSTDNSSIYRYDEPKKFSRNPSMASSYSSPSSTPSMISGASSVVSVPITHSAAARSSNNQCPNNNMMMIQQRRTDPLTFGGSDALWDTIAKSQGSDVTVEKIISNFLRRGGSPNTSKQSPSTHNVKYGYGMIHALIATKAANALDLLLQQGANPNTMSMSQVDDDKVSPCYLAASMGWLHGLEKLVEAGGDLMSARGQGSKKKTALHVAAEQGHAACVEYIVNMTQGVLNLETDSLGANALHYACASGHTELVMYILNACQVPINDLDSRGESALHWAVKLNRIDVVTVLVERYGCDVNHYVVKQKTPYDVAKSCGYKKIAEYLKLHGALTSKKMDKKREEEMPKHLTSALAKNGFIMDF